MAVLLIYLILGMVFLGMRMKRRYEDGFRQALQELEDCRALFWRDRLRAHDAELVGEGEEAAEWKVAATHHVRRAQQLHEHVRREYRHAAMDALGMMDTDPQVMRMLHSLGRALEPGEVEIAAQLAAAAPADGEPSRALPTPEDAGMAISLFAGGVLGSVAGIAVALYQQGMAFDPSSADTTLAVVTCMAVFALLAAVFRETFWLAVAWVAYVAFHASTTPGGWRAFRRQWRPHW